MRMRRMGFRPQGIDDPHIQFPQFLEGFGRKIVQVSGIGHVAKAKTKTVHATMYLPEGLDVNISNSEGSINQMGCGNWRIIPGGGKNVAEPLRDALHRASVAIYRNSTALQNHEPTQIINAIHMVGVIVCLEGSIQAH